MNPTPPLAARVRVLALIGLCVGLARYALEFAAPDLAMYFGVYYVMPLLLIVVGVQGRWGDIRWTTMVGTMFVLCLIVWGIPNTLAYTTGQFLEWQHGRFFNAGPGGEGTRAAPIAADAWSKVGLGVMQGLLTAVAGSAWCTAWGTLVIWGPARLRRRRQRGR